MLMHKLLDSLCSLINNNYSGVELSFDDEGFRLRHASSNKQSEYLSSRFHQRFNRRVETIIVEQDQDIEYFFFAPGEFFYSSNREANNAHNPSRASTLVQGLESALQLQEDDNLQTDMDRCYREYEKLGVKQYKELFEQSTMQEEQELARFQSQETIRFS